MGVKQWTRRIGYLFLVGIIVGTVGLTSGAIPFVQAGQVSQETPTATSVSLTDPVEVLRAQNLVMADLYEQVIPSVVNVRVTKRVSTSESRFGRGLPNMPREFFQRGSGSGFVIDDQGHIVTNYHVVEDADEVEAVFSDGTTLSAEVVGADPTSDLAVIKVDPNEVELQPLVLGDSDQVRVGEIAVAIGNPFGLAGTMTSGIISAKGRTLPTNGRFSIPDVLQTDTAINPGNSGGPLLNIDGEVIGVTTAILGDSSFAGVGFAVPVNLVRRVVPDLISTGAPRLPWLGIEGRTVTSDLADALELPVERGAQAMSVIGDSPADKSGLRGSDHQIEYRDQMVEVGGDIITSIDGKTIGSMDDLITYLLRETEVGQEIVLTIVRDGDEMSVEVTLEARPTNLAALLEDSDR